MKVSISDPAKLDLANIIAYLIGLNRRAADKLSALFEEKLQVWHFFPSAASDGLPCPKMPGSLWSKPTL